MGRRRKFKHGGNESEVTIDKSKKYKWDTKGDFVEYTGTAAKNEIIVSGSKSSLRRMADMERNIGILATTLTSSDDGADDGENASFGKNVNQTTRFKKSIRLDSGANLKGVIDMNDNKITEVATCTAGTDAANKTYVDGKVSGAITDIVDEAGTSYDTLIELRDAILANDSDITSILTTQSTKVDKTSNQALGTAANAMTISGHTITLARGDSTTDTVVVPDNNDNTTYSVQDGELSEINFTSADNTKLDGIAASATNNGSGTVSAMLPLAGGAMTGAITTNSTFDGVDVAARDAILSSTTTTAGAALPKAGGTMSGDIAMGGNDITGAGTFYGIATTAQYADLAERYAADATYEEGTVLAFGGEAEVTSTQGYGSTKIAGVVSTKPGFAMNEEAGNSETHPYIALQGRVPCKVTGTVSKGDILVASEVSGTATKWLEDSVDPRMTAYVGIAIEDKTTDGEGYVEVKVGK
jgi:hypothetical protein